MAQITHETGLIWLGSTDSCQDVELSTQLGKIRKVFISTQTGSIVDSNTPELAEFGMGFSYIKCGSAYLVYSKSDGLPYDMDSAITGNLESDNGRVDLTSVNLVERFSTPTPSLFSDQDISGTYVMTTTFFGNKPLYRNENGWYAVYNDDSTWSLKDSLTQPTSEYKNDNINPSDGVYVRVNVGSPGPIPTPSPTPSPVPPALDAEILARWDAQYASSDVYVEDPISGYNFLAPPATIKSDLSAGSRGKVFTFSNEAHFCKLGDILNETFNSASFSISFWCNPNHAVALGQYTGCYQDDNSGFTCRSSIMLGKWYSSGGSSYKNSWLIYSNGALVSDGSDQQTPGSTYLSESIPTNMGTWTHLTYSFQPVNSSQAHCKVYMNGVDVTHPDSVNVLHSFDVDSSTPLVLGNISWNGYPGRYGYWGSLDDIRIYNGPLSAQDALAIYNGSDSESQRQPFNIPTIEAVETTIPMSEGIEKTTAFDIMLDPNVYGIDVIGDEVAVVVPRSEGGNIWTPVVRFYTKREWPPTDPFDNHGRYIRTETNYVDISEVVSDPSDVKYFKWIKTESPSRNILIIWTQDYGLRMFKQFSDGSWVSSGIAVNMATDESKIEYIEYDNITEDVVVIFNHGNVTSYKQDSYGFWYILGNKPDVSGVSVAEKQMILSYHRSTQDAFSLSMFDITNASEIPGTPGPTNEIGYYTYQGSYNSNDLALLATGNDVYVTFTGTQNESFKFDPSDGYLSHASPSTIYQLSENLNLLQTTFPPYRLSGIDYKHVHKFGEGVHVGNKYMVVTANLCEFAWLYEKSSNGEWEFVSRLVYGDTSPTPRCFVGDDYCLIHCGETGGLNRLVYFELGESLTSTDETLSVVDDDLVAWWDLGPRHGPLETSSHIAFDKSGHNNHLGVSNTYTSLASSDIPGAMDSSEIYKFDNLNSPCVCKSPISDDVFTGDFTVLVWFYRTNESTRAIISKADSLGNSTFDINRSFVMYANGNMYVGETGIHQLTTPIKSNEWTFLTLVRSGPITQSYINGHLSSEVKEVTSGHTDEDLQVAPQGDIGYLDDIKIYKKALTSVEIQEEFEKSYRHQLLTT